MPGRGDGLRGADRQAEDMAVPSAISEKSLLRVPQDDLLISGSKSRFNGRKVKLPAEEPRKSK